MKFRGRNRLAIVGGTMLALGYLLVFQTGFDGIAFSGTLQEFDLQTGRVNTTKYLLGVPVSQSERGTWLTTALPPLISASTKRSWHRVSKIGWIDHSSPTYRYGGCLTEIRLLENITSIAEFSIEAREAVATEFLRLAQADDSLSMAEAFVQTVSELAFSDSESGTPVTAEKLQEWLRSKR